MTLISAPSARRARGARARAHRRRGGRRRGPPERVRRRAARGGSWGGMSRRWWRWPHAVPGPASSRRSAAWRLDGRSGCPAALRRQAGRPWQAALSVLQSTPANQPAYAGNIVTPDGVNDFLVGATNPVSGATALTCDIVASSPGWAGGSPASCRSARSQAARRACCCTRTARPTASASSSRRRARPPTSGRRARRRCRSPSTRFRSTCPSALRRRSASSRTARCSALARRRASARGRSRTARASRSARRTRRRATRRTRRSWGSRFADGVGGEQRAAHPVAAVDLHGSEPVPLSATAVSALLGATSTAPRTSSTAVGQAARRIGVRCRHRRAGARRARATAYWTMDGSLPTVLDQSGHGNHLTRYMQPAVSDVPFILGANQFSGQNLTGDSRSGRVAAPAHDRREGRLRAGEGWPFSTTPSPGMRRSSTCSTSRRTRPRTPTRPGAATRSRAPAARSCRSPGHSARTRRRGSAALASRFSRCTRRRPTSRTATRFT